MTTDPLTIVLDPGDPRELCLLGVEVWRPVPGTSYEASNLGQIRNPKTGRIIGTGMNSQGYYVIPGMLVHRAVLSAFDGPRPPNMVGRHGDGGAKDNRLCNLVWGTRQENAEDTAAQGRLRTKNGEVAPLDPKERDRIVEAVANGTMTYAEGAKQANRSVGWVQGLVRRFRNPEVTASQSPVSLEEARRLAEEGVEVWVPGVGIRGFEVSNLGRVRLSSTKTPRKATPEARDGYVRVDGALLHRVVMLSFSDPPFPGAVVRHTPDPNRANCALTNLKWGTYAENGEDTREHGRSHRGSAHGRAVLNEALIEEGFRLYLENKWTTAQLSDFWGGIGQGNASDIINGKKWAHVPRPPELGGSIRRRKGGSHHLSHLTDEQVREAFVLAAQNKWGAVKLAAHLKVSVPTGSQMLSGKTWRHIPRPVELLRSSSCASPPASESPMSRDLASLVSRVRSYAASAEEGSFRLADDDHAILTREELILVTREVGTEAVERELYPAVFDFFRAHVRRWGWFYPSSDATLAQAIRDVQVTGSSDEALSSRSRAGTGFLHARFKSFWNVDGGPVRAFAKDNLLRNVLRYRLGLNNSKDYTYKLSNGEVVTTRETFDINVKNVRRGFVVQRASASFFKPAAAFHLYRKWMLPTAGDAPRVWDPSCGFGARLLGFAAAFPKGTYLGNEPAAQTWEDDVSLASDLQSAGMLAGFDIVRAGSEKQVPFDAESLDLVFTSPPYFDLERYYDEPGQCWRDYPSEVLWYEKYLLPTFAAAFVGLRPGAHAIINMDERRRAYILRAAQEVGFDFVAEDALKLGSDHFARKRGGTASAKEADERGEPIFVFRRP